jgi:hypothetical protein
MAGIDHRIHSDADASTAAIRRASSNQRSVTNGSPNAQDDRWRKSAAAVQYCTLFNMTGGWPRSSHFNLEDLFFE